MSKYKTLSNMLDNMVDDIVDKIKNEFGNYVIEIGVFSDDTGRKEESIQLGVTNAELMYIHENGSPLQSIPRRPVLHMTIQYAQSQFSREISKAIQAYIQSNGNKKAFEQSLEKFCMRLENYARKIIYSNDGRLAPNAPSVARAKGGNHPLFDTGQLARSITCRLIQL